MKHVIILVVSFFIYCFAGWVWESLILPLFRRQIPYNSGFLNGPWIPIYGFGAILVIVLFDIRQVDYPIYILFIYGGTTACILEYVTSYVMEKIFHRRWWDYSQRQFNLNGRICLEGFICFSLFSVIAIHYVQPFFTRMLLQVDENVLVWIGGILSLLFIFDTLVSTKIALGIEKMIDDIRKIIEEREEKIIAAIEEHQARAVSMVEQRNLEIQRYQLVIKALMKNKQLFKYGQRRLFKAFPNLIKKRGKDK